MDCLLTDDDVSGEESDDFDEYSTVSKNEPQRKLSQVKTEVDTTGSNKPDDIRNIRRRESENIVEKNRHNAGRINTRALTKHSGTYELEKFEKKLLIIFNHVHVQRKKPRVGTDKDVIALTKRFEKFGFTIIVKTDWKEAAIMKELKAWTDRDYSDYGCFAVAVLTHGNEHGHLMAKDKCYKEENIINSLKTDANPTFITKPRILMIQACRGRDDGEGVSVYPTVYKDNARNEQPYKLPVEADMLIVHSSYAGKASYRTENGSWFIQTLCKKIDDLALEEDLQSILQDTNRVIATDFEVYKYDKKKFKTVIEKQMPVITSTLTRKLYLRRYQEP